MIRLDRENELIVKMFRVDCKDDSIKLKYNLMLGLIPCLCLDKSPSNRRDWIK